jgi:kumamolisin
MAKSVIFDHAAVPEGASRTGWLDPDRRIEFTVVLAARQELPSIHSAELFGSPHLNHAELRKSYGPNAKAARLVESFAKTFNLQIVENAEQRRNMRLGGRSEDVARAFGTKFGEFELDGHTFFAPTRPLNAPKDWEGLIEAVLGLHSSRHTSPRRRSAVHGGGSGARLPDLARAYAFPPGLEGSGETIGLIEFGGGFCLEDIELFCFRSGLTAPRISVVEVGGGANRPASRRAVHEFLDVANGKLSLAAKTEQSAPFIAAQCTVEVTMDLEILVALAPAAHIVVYFASGDEQGLYHALNRAVHDEQHRPGILSISWSLPEHTLSASELRAIESLLQEAAHLGITVCASSGDAGALNGSTDGKPSVNYPASSPHCLACGGTSGKVDAARIPEEVVWNASHYGFKGASGGGVSARFHLPAWQAEAHVPAGPDGWGGRGVPDVAGLADPRYGCELLIAGRTFASAGTSAVAPMWAALIARLNQALGHRCGHLHSHIYRLGKEGETALRPVLKGDNGFYQAGKGWSACTGYGTPRGDELLAHLRKESLSKKMTKTAGRSATTPVIVSGN